LKPKRQKTPVSAEVGRRSAREWLAPERFREEDGKVPGEVGSFGQCQDPGDRIPYRRITRLLGDRPHRTAIDVASAARLEVWPDDFGALITAMEDDPVEQG